MGIEIINVSKTYLQTNHQETKALQSATIKFTENSMIGLIGKSGSGKTTLLNLLSGMDSISSGHIIVNNQDLSTMTEIELEDYRNEKIGFIFQDYYLFDELSVLDNITIASDLQNTDNLNKIKELLIDLEIDHLAHHKIKELSGGEKQRVAIARAIIKEPEILLADEPTGNLDSETGEIILKILKNISKTKLVILVTHDVENAEKYCERLIKLKDGKIIEDREINTCESIKTFEKNVLLKPKFPLLFSFKLMMFNFGMHKIKLTLSILLAALATGFFAVAVAISLFNFEDASVDTFDSQKMNYITVDKVWNDVTNLPTNNVSKADFEIIKTSNENILLGLVKEININFTEVTFNEIEGSPDEGNANLLLPNDVRGIVVVSEDSDFDMTYGRLPNNDTEIALMDFHYDHLFYPGDEQRIGIDLSINVNGETYLVVGVINSNYRNTYQKLSNVQLSSHDPETRSLISRFMVDLQNWLDYVYMNEEGYDRFIIRNDYLIFLDSLLGNNQSAQTTMSEHLNQSEFVYFDNTQTVASDQVIIDINTFNSIFETTYSSEDFYNGTVNLDDYNQNKVTLILSANGYYINLTSTSRQVYIKDVIILNQNSTDYIDMRDFIIPRTIIFSEYKAGEILSELYMYDSILTKFEPNEKGEYKNLLHELGTSYEHDTYISHNIYLFSRTAVDLIPFITGVAVFFLIFSILLLTLLLTSIIKNQTYQIGVLSALGMRKKYILGMYGLGNLILGVTILVISIPLHYILIEWVSTDIADSLDFIIVAYRSSYLCLIAMLFVTIVGCDISLIIPFKRINKLKPIEIIKH